MAGRTRGGGGFRTVESLVGRAVARPEVVRGARAWAVMARWAEVVGEPLAARSEPDRYDRGVIWVAVRGSEWAQELRLMKETILARLNEMACETLFADVRFGVRKARPKPNIPPAHEEPVPPSEKPDWRDGLTIREIADRRLADLHRGDVGPSD